MRSSWTLPVDVVSKSSQEAVAITKKIENTSQPVFGLGFHSRSIEGRWPRNTVTGVLNEVRSLVRTRQIFRCLIATGTFIERELLSMKTRTRPR